MGGSRKVNLELKSIQIASFVRDDVWNLLAALKTEGYREPIGFNGHIVVGTQAAIDHFCSIWSGKLKIGQGTIFRSLE